MTPYSYLSILIVGADVAITTVLLFGVRRALLATGRTSTDVRGIMWTLGGMLFGWLALALFLGWLNIFRTAYDQRFPYIALAMGIPIVIGAALIRWSGRVREIIDVVPQNWLVGFQLYRVVGAIFLVLYAAGLLPGIFAIPAGYGDVFVGLTAPLVAIGYARYHSQSDQFVALWNWFGIADLVIAVATGFLSAPSRLQMFSLDAPNLLIGSFPLVMIPIYAVPLSIVLHLASLTKLRQGKNARMHEFKNSRSDQNPNFLTS
jgi:hypothetical protein